MKSTKNYFDLETDEPKKISEDDLADNESLARDDVFKSVGTCLLLR